MNTRRERQKYRESFVSRRQLRKRSKMEKRFDFLFKVSLFIIVPLFIVTVFSVITGMRIMYVVSDSMNPTFVKGDLLVLSQEHFNGLTEGDIVAYEADWHPQGLITHRIVNKTSETIITQGDNNNSPDPSITEENIVGEIVGIVPKIGVLFEKTTLIIIAISSSILYSITLFFKSKAALKIWKQRKTFS